MTYSAPQVGELPPVFLNSYDISAQGNTLASVTPASTAWVVANRMIYVPFALSVGSMVYRYFWLNGATATTNNIQIGVYRTNFTRVNAGTSTLASGANVLQFDNITDYYLAPGRYYMAMWANGTTVTPFAISNTAGLGEGAYYETNASGLPATGTPVDPATTTTPYVPVFGLALRATDP